MFLSSLLLKQMFGLFELLFSRVTQVPTAPIDEHLHHSNCGTETSLRNLFARHDLGHFRCALFEGTGRWEGGLGLYIRIFCWPRLGLLELIEADSPAEKRSS